MVSAAEGADAHLVEETDEPDRVRGRADAVVHRAREGDWSVSGFRRSKRTVTLVVRRIEVFAVPALRRSGGAEAVGRVRLGKRLCARQLVRPAQPSKCQRPA